MLLAIEWIVIGAFALMVGAVIAYFWDEITAWATRVVEGIIDAINHAIEVTSDAIVYLVKQGHRYYKKAEAYVMDIQTGRTRIESRQQEISKSEIPQEFLAQLWNKAKLKLLQSST